MEKAINFLKSHTDLAVATIDMSNKPRLNTFQVRKIDKKGIYFATSPEMDVHLQLQYHPEVEVLASDGNVSVKISGVVDFDVSDKMCKTIFKENPDLCQSYSSHNDLIYFRLEMDQIDYYDQNTTSMVTDHYQTNHTL